MIPTTVEVMATMETCVTAVVEMRFESCRGE
jgi:hypothetical protein